MKQNRNAPCACGSRKKAKHCCMRTGSGPQAAEPKLSVSMNVIQRSEALAGIIRGCDGCQACCAGALTINDPELVVPRGRACANLNAVGCSIHGPSLPKTCTGFICSYLVEPGDLTPDDRPDHVGAIVRLARNQKFAPPMDRVVHLNECKPDGMSNILRNPKWGMILRNDLVAGIPLLCSFWEDDLAREIIHLRYVDGRLRCELTSCHPDGSPILQIKEPTFAEPITAALIIPQQFALDANVLVEQLGDCNSLVVGASRQTESGRNLCFWFTHRQAELVRAMQRLINDGPTPINEPDAQSRVLQLH